MLPIIDLNPSDEATIYSTLTFIKAQAKQLNVVTPCITFDQPLWYKAVGIIAEKNLDIVCRLGGFHTMMSFMGSVGHLMVGSGIQDILEQIYEDNVVKHMISGKAVPRALRGHYLLEAALVFQILTVTKHSVVNQIPESVIISEGINETDDHHLISLEDFEKIVKLVEDAINKNISPDKLSNSTTLQYVNNALCKKKETLSRTSRTVQLWVQYLSYVSILKTFV